MFSESEWSFTFTLRIADDRKKVARSLGFDQIQEPIRDLHGFWVAYVTWVEPMYFTQLDTTTLTKIERRVETSDYATA
jgi:hypothetical protein